MARVGQRRYLFPDRATAEAEGARQASLAFRYRLALEAALQSGIEWIRGAAYDAGIVGKERADGGLVLITYHGRNLNQRPSTTVYTPDDIRAWHRSLWNAHSAEEREVGALLARVLERIA